MNTYTEPQKYLVTFIPLANLPKVMYDIVPPPDTGPLLLCQLFYEFYESHVNREYRYLGEGAMIKKLIHFP